MRPEFCEDRADHDIDPVPPLDIELFPLRTGRHAVTTRRDFITLEDQQGLGLGSSQLEHLVERSVQLAFEELGFFTREVRILGTYPADPFRHGAKIDVAK